MKLLLLPGSWTSPASRVRVLQFAEPLRLRGHQVTTRVIWPDRHWKTRAGKGWTNSVQRWLVGLLRLIGALWMTRDAEQFDAVFMNKDIVPEVKICFLEPYLSRRGAALIFDFDDAVYLGARGEKLEKIFPAFCLVTAGNKTLCKYAEQLKPGRVVQIPTVVDTDKIFPVINRRGGPVRIGWSGSSFTAPVCLPLVKDVICELARSNEFEFVVISEKDPELNWPGVRVRYIPWTPDTETAGLQQIDIGLMPLEDSPFERGKCGMKAIQYMAVGAPALVSPVGANEEIVLNEQTGFHCRTQADWTRALILLMRDETLRIKMGKAARERALNYYSVSAILPKLESVFRDVVEDKIGH